MSLTVDIRITNSAGYTNRIEYINIRRLEKLNSENAQDEEHPYLVSLFDKIGNQTDSVMVTHRYGDGARVLVSRALEALTENEKQRSGRG